MVRLWETRSWQFLGRYLGNDLYIGIRDRGESPFGRMRTLQEKSVFCPRLLLSLGHQSAIIGSYITKTLYAVFMAVKATRRVHNELSRDPLTEKTYPQLQALFFQARVVIP